MKENQCLVDQCEELERKRQKIEHDLQTKEAHVSCLEGQLSHCKQAVEAETAKASLILLETMNFLGTFEVNCDSFSLQFGAVDF